MRMMAAGVSLPTAIKEALKPLTVQAFAAKYERIAPTISAIINSSVRPSDADIEALISELGGTTDEWRLLLWEHSKPIQAEA